MSALIARVSVVLSLLLVPLAALALAEAGVLLDAPPLQPASMVAIISTARQRASALRMFFFILFLLLIRYTYSIFLSGGLRRVVPGHS